MTPSVRVGEPSTAAVPVLVVDDDPLILNAFRRMTRDLGVRLLCARSAEEAPALLELESPALIICDYQLPGMDGITFLKLARARYPGARAILHTGTTQVPPPELGIGILPKPSGVGEIRALVESCYPSVKTPIC